VDDNRDAADSTAMLLWHAGFEARACYDGPTALEAAEGFRPSVCLIDLNMPGMDGDELALRLRALYCGRPLLLVALTAMSSEECRTRTRDAGFHLHVVKPVDPEQLLVVVDELFRIHQSTGAEGASR
jgi:CheY-like chemotaxis protein